MTKLIDQVEINKYANDYIKMVENICQKEIYVKFKLASVKLDWSPNRRSSRGGYYADGPGINIAMSNIVRENNGEIYRVYEYKSFDSDPDIGGIYTRNKWHKLELVILHEIAHALQYYSYKINNFRCKPHGPTWRNFYSRLRNRHLNPYLENQPALKEEYEKEIKKISNSFSLKRAAGGR